MSSENLMDLLSVCRTCGGRGETVSQLGIGKSCTVTLADAYKYVTCLDISDDDGLPQTVCRTCCKKLYDSYQFKKQAEQTYHMLEEIKDQSDCTEGEEKLIEIVTGMYEEDEEEDDDDESEFVNLDTNAVDFLSNTKMVVSLPSKQRNKFSSNDRKHECQVCHKKFLRKSNLVDHLRLHANVKLYKCEHCGKAFVQSGNYKSHVRTHTKERPFVCHICKKSYNQSSALKIHIRSHTNERNYRCGTCTKAFTNSSDLNKHKRVHDPSQQFKCDFCDKAFAQKANLRLHQNNNHKLENSEVK